MKAHPLRLVVACVLLTAPLVAIAADNLIGFDGAGSSAELALEQKLDAGIDPADLRAWLKDLSAAPNQVGSPHDRRNAEKMRDMLASWGWDARIEVFQVAVPHTARRARGDDCPLRPYRPAHRAADCR